MSSHDCRISGVLSLKEGVGEQEVRAALGALLEYVETTYDEEVAADGIEFEEAGTLSLNIDFRGAGNGCRNESLEAGLEALSAVVLGSEWVEVQDFDTGDSELACVPRFFGSSLEKKAGRLQYGINLSEDWIKPLIGDQAFEAMVTECKENFRKAQCAPAKTVSLGM